jgi:hypothetical protein
LVLFFYGRKTFFPSHNQNQFAMSEFCSIQGCNCPIYLDELLGSNGTMIVNGYCRGCNHPVIDHVRRIALPQGKPRPTF